MMDDYLREIECKSAHDPYCNNNINSGSAKRSVWVPKPIIIGAGPSGLAVAACLKLKGVPSLILERESCVASLWQLKTYDRLKLHLPKHYCELPFMPFPPHFPTYPSRPQFVQYLEDYAARFDVRPVFDQTVVSAAYDGCYWRVGTAAEVEYVIIIN